MELPIRVMAVLFVTLIVAVIVIQFSREMITSSQYKLRGVFEDTDKDKILQLSTASASQIVYLADECYKYGTSNVANTEICFAVHFETSIATDPGSISTEWAGIGQDPTNLNLGEYGTGGNSLFFYYDRSADEVQIKT
ncbi:hypothetical protein K9M79_08790 [Candidatus Woesearchaeota archaeon]|nr:hypothetical protein [Candidatus Woesearchaeota archaeon]